MVKKLLLAIVGPTAVGKTEIAIEVALRLNGEIISADSMQIYRYMDIGTAKPTLSERKGVPHHMIDIVDPDKEFSVADFQSMAKDCIADIHARGKLPILSGGTGLYVNAVCYNYAFCDFEKDEELRLQLKSEAEKYGNEFLYEKLKQVDPKAAEKIHPNNLRRIIRALEVYIKTGVPFSYSEELTKQQESPYDLLIFGLTRPREELYERINKRVLLMIEKGFVDEVKRLLEMGYSEDLNPMQGLGYRQIIDYLQGRITLEEAIYLISRDTRRYAKRQYTWFRKDKNIIWLDVSREGERKIIENIVKSVEGKLKNS
ncbi:tRNA (adenosine(37)-N6)-dimethylallyltransferase MiaA [Thermosediminibacter oceani]|uniref:tRNA dimethylallyltransferase n=1 Tax=Thermosediminibacter oceani (strain ATCC BAA-1034 / DSM 16646 / JW/IW-1228P) TaxID=555079 RepID=D9S3G8_THEOJ|nr:tRNA (adenosine(37)-N6)-dimethylallyltransferase MiaA [Thermosediminibacter oceani]ADL07945.1 tRNA delta(2)-isopentenylpyrophosphate transferase [Thermosediminibacter oceani DSM 16646]